MARIKRRFVFWAALAGPWLIAGGSAIWSDHNATGAPGPAAGNMGRPSNVAQAWVLPNPTGPLAERMNRARGQAKANGWDKGFWLGFGIRRLMGENSSIGWHPWGGPEMRLTLDDLINGRKTPLEKKIANEQAIRGTAASLPEAGRSFAAGRMGEDPERPVLREIAILLLLSPAETAFPVDIRISNLNLPFDFEELPFVWMGMAADAESLDFLIPLYSKAAAEEDKRSLLWAIGLHRNAAVVVPFIERILAGKEKEEVRAEAAACLGEQNDPRSLELLIKTVKSDPSAEVRERAVQGLVELELPASAQALISFALGGADGEVRKEAVRGLAEKATADAVGALGKISAADKDWEVQSEAIHALADLPRGSGLPRLLDLVKTHSDSKVRTEAVEAIGDVGGGEAVKILKDLARGRKR